MADANKPSFFGSVISGITGYIKGALAGGAVGIATGAVLGAIVGAIVIGTGGMAGAAVVGAMYLGSAFGGIGALAGTVTGVVKSRETGQPSAQDIANVAKASYQQGVSVGMAQAQEQETTIHRDRLDAERASRAVSQRIH
jgi:hypothetical protein